eukprot:Hpha_TRINITY_DN26846_c0_g1::TRINITY_DN26846_c0_g1_i1::g.17388::m.17388
MPVPLLIVAAAVSLPPACSNLTGYWYDPNGAEQQLTQKGSEVVISAGLLGTGNVSGLAFTFLPKGGNPATQVLQGTFNAMCNELNWTGGRGVWRSPCSVGSLAQPPPKCGGTSSYPALCCNTPQYSCIRGKAGQPQCAATPNIETIHVVYMTHLDLGYTDTTHNVCDKYFDGYFAAAMNTSAQLKARGGEEEFSWTEFPWIIQEYLDGAAGCGSHRRTLQQIQDMEEAIRNGTIIWQANAVNFLTEVLDEEMWAYSFKMKDKLNARFGKQLGNLAGKLSDTTGMSRSAIPALAKAGVKAFHIGYNGVGGLPETEPTFVWRDQGTGAELLTMIEADYGKEVDLPAGTEASIVTANSSALVFLYTMDNSGPPTYQQVVDFWAGLRKKHPTAKIMSSTLDRFAVEALKHRAQLPVVTSELGDSWLYGGPADPIKVATFREAYRQLKAAKASNLVSESSPLYESYMRRLMKGPCEHNWGLSVGNFLPELRTPTNWDNAGFHSVRDSKRYMPLEQEWAQQREWMHPLPAWSYKNGWSRGAHSPTTHSGYRPPTQAEARQWSAFEHTLTDALIPLVTPEPPSIAGLTPYAGQRLACAGAQVQIDTETGAITSLVDAMGREWSNGQRMGRVTYRTYSADNFKQFGSEYAGGDFGKAGCESASPEDAEWNTTSTDIRYEVRNGICRVVVRQTFPQEAYTKYGAPKDVMVEVLVGGEYLAQINVVWFNKTATRLPESLWISFTPTVTGGARWTMDVMGHAVDPMDVLRGGTWYKHFVQKGVYLNDSSGTTLFEFLDTGLVSPTSTGNMLHFCRERGWGGTATCELEDPARGGGMHANMYNNLWGTAFPQWYDDDGSARFRIHNPIQKSGGKRTK